MTIILVQCTEYNIQCTVYSVQCTVYNIQCTMYSVQCTLYNVHELMKLGNDRHHNQLQCMVYI